MKTQNLIFSILPMPKSNNPAWGGARTCRNRAVPAKAGFLIQMGEYRFLTAVEPLMQAIVGDATFNRYGCNSPQLAANN